MDRYQQTNGFYPESPQVPMGQGTPGGVPNPYQQSSAQPAPYPPQPNAQPAPYPPQASGPYTYPPQASGPYTYPPQTAYGQVPYPPQPAYGQAYYPPQPGGESPAEPTAEKHFASDQTEYQKDPQYIARQTRRGGGGMKNWQMLVVVASLLLCGLYLWNTLSPEAQPYATVRSGTLGAHYTGDALIVRSEIPYDAEGVTSIEYSAEEGKNVLRNMPICNVFSSGFSTREMTTLQEYRDQIRDYQRTLLQQETTYDARMARAEADVLSRSKDVREIIAGTRGSLTNQEKLLDTAIEARQLYLRQKYSSDQRLSRLYDDEQAQMQRIDSWTKQYIAAMDTIVSFYSDGFEYGLTTSNYDQYTPSDVRKMINGEKPASAAIPKGKTTIYRTINDGLWVVLMLVDNNDWNPIEGQTYQLQLERFENTLVNATVTSFTRSGGELLVRLTVEAPVTPVLYMRTCKAELGDYVSTLMVPARAIHHYQEMDGVVVVDGGNQSFIPVTVTLRDGDWVYVTAISQGLLFEGQTVRLF